MAMRKREWNAFLAASGPAVLHPAFLLLVALPAAVGFQQRSSSPPPLVPSTKGTVTARVVEAANTFLAALTAAERTRCTFGFASSQRTGWSNLPSGIFQRNGLRFGDMTPGQREAALKLVAAALSREGYQKVTDIMNGDEVLKNAGGGRTGGRPGQGIRFGLDEYYIALLGTPSATT